MVSVGHEALHPLTSSLVAGEGGDRGCQESDSSVLQGPSPSRHLSQSSDRKARLK